jgi:hypothetical protein
MFNFKFLIMERIEIESLAFTKVTNNRFYNLIHRSVEIVEKSGFPATHVIRTGLALLSKHKQELFKILSRMVNYSKRMQLDAVRDADFMHLTGFLDTYATSRKPEIKEAAEALLKIFETEKRAGLTRLDMNDQTTVMARVMAFWDKDENQAHLTTLGMTDDYSELKKSVNAFNEYDVNRTQESEGENGNTTSKRKEVYKIYIDLLDVLKGLANLTKDELCHKALSRMNVLIAEEATYLKSKAGRNEKVEEEEVLLEE